MASWRREAVAAVYGEVCVVGEGATQRCEKREETHVHSYTHARTQGRAVRCTAERAMGRYDTGAHPRK